MKHCPALLLVAATLAGNSPTPSLASVGVCELPNCPGAEHLREAEFKAYYKSYRTRSSETRAFKALGGETLQAPFAGDFDDVTAIVAFPYPVSDVTLQLVAMALPASDDGDGQYSAAGWHRELFFLDAGDSVPRLLSSYLINADFTPSADDVVTQSGQLWVAPNLLYQEAEELARDPDFYAGHEFGASVADFRFVADADGNVLEIAVDVFDDGGNYLYSVEPQIGDQYTPSFIGYDLDEPDVLYALSYFEDLVEMTDALSIQRRYYVPTGADDSALPADFDASTVAVSVFMEGGSYFDGEGNFAYGPLTSLGYDWGGAGNCDPQ